MPQVTVQALLRGLHVPDAPEPMRAKRGGEKGDGVRKMWRGKSTLLGSPADQRPLLEPASSRVQHHFAYSICNINFHLTGSRNIFLLAEAPLFVCEFAGTDETPALFWMRVFSNASVQRVRYAAGL